MIKNIPHDSRRHPVAKGSIEKSILGVDSSGSSQVTSSSSWLEFFMPIESDVNGAVITVGNPRPTTPDKESNYEGFLWCHIDPVADSTAVILAFDFTGKSSGIAIQGGESLGFFKSTTAGQSVILWGRE